MQDGIALVNEKRFCIFVIQGLASNASGVLDIVQNMKNWNLFQNQK